MHTIAEFLTTHLTDLFVVTVGWFVLQMIAKPILRVRELRSEALRLAGRYSHCWIEQDERVSAVRRELFDIASKVRAQARGQSWPIRCYCGLLQYDLEEAAGALNGLGSMTGDPRYPELVRQNNLNHVYISLGAHRHLSHEALRAHREMVAKMAHENTDAKG
jgi:hypothetical protein